MTVLTLALYVPQFFIAGDVQERVTAINFIFDTLLFAGTVLVVSRAISDSSRGDHPIARGGALPVTARDSIVSQT